MQLMFMDIDRRVACYQLHRHSSPERWRLFLEKVELSWLYHDYAMDGTALTPQEVQRALTGAPARHHCDGLMLAQVRRTHSAIHHVLHNTHATEGFSLEGVKNFHALLVEPGCPSAGRYRKVEGPMVPYLHSITRTPSISYRLRKLVESMETTYRDMHPIRAAAELHHEFMGIWPFDMRSGTAGRLLLGSWLLAAGYPPAIIHAIDRQRYYSALSKGPEAMVPLVAEAIKTTLRGAEGFFGVEDLHNVA